MKIRPAMMMPSRVENGDVLLDVPWINHAERPDKATVIGTVVGDMAVGGTWFWKIQTTDGVIEKEIPEHLVHVHVPTRSQADQENP